jgi:hypothetical protein
MKSVKYKVQIVKLKSPDKENRDFAKNAQLFTTECTEDTEQELLSDLEQELRPRITRISRNKVSVGRWHACDPEIVYHNIEGRIYA